MLVKTLFLFAVIAMCFVTPAFAESIPMKIKETDSKPLSIMDAAKKVVLEGGSPSLIKDEARMDRMDKLLGVIPSEKYKSGGRAKPKLALKGGGRAYGRNS